MNGSTRMAGRSAVVAWGTMLLALAACGGSEGSCPPARLRPAAPEAHFAVVTSDYVSTAVALLDDSGALLESAWVDSGTVAPGLAMALSGDVTLPSEPPPPGQLLLLDRYGTDVVDVFDLRAGRLRAQWSVGGRVEDSGGWRANPHDALRLPGEEPRWAISRFEPNLLPGAPGDERGDDLLVVGAEGEPLAVWPIREGRGEAPSGAPIWARPSRMVRVDGWIVVGLARLSADFREAAPGAVAVLDAASGRVSDLCELPGLRNCPEVAAGVGGGWDVWVACRGTPFVPLAVRRREAGVARLRLDRVRGTCTALERVAGSEGTGPVASGGLVPLSEGAAVAVAEGEAAAGEPDRLLWFGPSGERAVLWTAEEAFSLGGGARSGDGHLLLVPEAGRGILRFEVPEAGPPRWLGTTTGVSPCRGLPARQIGRLR